MKTVSEILELGKLKYNDSSFDEKTFSVYIDVNNVNYSCLVINLDVDISPIFTDDVPLFTVLSCEFQDEFGDLHELVWVESDEVKIITQTQDIFSKGYWADELAYYFNY